MIKAIDYSTVTLHSLYAFVLMDLNMPVLDGYESCKKITDFFKTSKKVKFIKIDTENDED